MASATFHKNNGKYFQRQGLYCCLYKLMQPLWKTVWHCVLSYNPGTNAAETRAYDHQETYSVYSGFMCTAKTADNPNAHELGNLQIGHGKHMQWNTMPPWKYVNYT